MSKEIRDVPNNLKTVETSFRKIKQISDRKNMPKLTSVYNYSLPTNHAIGNYSNISNSASNNSNISKFSSDNL